MSLLTNTCFDNAKKKLREELTRALLEATSIDDDGGGIGIRRAEPSNSEPVSFKDLVKDMTLNGQDIKAFAFKTKSMVSWKFSLSSLLLLFRSLILYIMGNKGKIRTHCSQTL